MKTAGAFIFAFALRRPHLLPSANNSALHSEEQPLSGAITSHMLLRNAHRKPPVPALADRHHKCLSSTGR